MQKRLVVQLGHVMNKMPEEKKEGMEDLDSDMPPPSTNYSHESEEKIETSEPDFSSTDMKPDYGESKKWHYIAGGGFILVCLLIAVVVILLTSGSDAEYEEEFSRMITVSHGAGGVMPTADLFETEILHRDYINFAVKEFYPEVCEEIEKVSGETSRDECYMNYAVKTETQEYCNTITKESGKYSRNTCYFEYALAQEDVSYCNKITVVNGTYSSEECIVAVGIQMKLNSCMTIKPPEECPPVMPESFREYFGY